MAAEIIRPGILSWIEVQTAFLQGIQMRILEMTPDECKEFLNRESVGRLGCSFEHQPYIVPVCYAYEPEYLFVFSTLGQKIKWMRQNPNVCLQTDEMRDRSSWISVIVNGTYRELSDPQNATEREHARARLARISDWWRTPLAERREHSSDLSIEPIFFRIDIASMTGLRGIPEPG